MSDSTRQRPSLLSDDPVGALGEAERTAALAKERFFHDMVLGGERTGTWVYGPELPSNYHLYPLISYLSELDLAGASCLDIGTFDGMTAFALQELGAGSIEATCQYDLDRFRLARAALGAGNVSYHPKTEIEELGELFGPASFDVAIASAMLHHLPSPLGAVLLCRRLLKRDGWLVLEAVIAEGKEPATTLNTELDDPVFGLPTLWLPTISALRGIVRLGSFEIVSETLLTGGKRGRETNYDRVTLLARAVTPDEMTGASPTAVETLKTQPRLGALDLVELNAGTGPRSSVAFSGAAGERTFNIWRDSIGLDLQPAWSDPEPGADASCRIARNSDFRRLVAANPADEFSEADLELLAFKYPGETMPDGMRWGLKQLGNLFVLDHVKRWGSERVLEIGPGFNLYFPNHLPGYVDYTSLDSEGFYDPETLALMRARLKRGNSIDGLIGAGTLEAASFDACISVSVLEHLPDDDVPGAARDMFRILEPGGWCVHSIDLTAESVPATMGLWMQELEAAGFLVAGRDGLELEPVSAQADPPHTEPPSITMRFYAGYQQSIWHPNLEQTPFPAMHSVLLAARKPL